MGVRGWGRRELGVRGWGRRELGVGVKRMGDGEVGGRRDRKTW
uniref:Uncharacterized protein n=1 Tax=Desertifilum tharense IPPAS B-1220 TaxID=1781255 RepID=A0ACD5GT65_9CYAN